MFYLMIQDNISRFIDQSGGKLPKTPFPNRIYFWDLFIFNHYEGWFYLFHLNGDLPTLPIFA